MKTFLFQIVVICVYCVGVVSTSGAATLHIGKGFAPLSIKQAVAQAAQGDSIIVHGGLYQESGTIFINKSLSLIGIDHPVIDAQGKYEPIGIEAHKVTIQGFTIKNSARSSVKDIAAIKIFQSSHIKIQHNILAQNFFGIQIQNSKHCLIENNRLQTHGENERLVGNGIHAWKSDSLQIIGNQVFGHRDGIYLEFVTHSLIDKNLSQHNLRYGLHFMFSHDNQYHYNSFRANGAGVAVMYTQRVHMLHNVFEENWGDASYGLLLKDISDSEIRHNSFLKNTTAIFMESSSRLQIKDNHFENNGWAIKIFTSCMHSQIDSNNFIQNSFDIASNGGKMTSTFSGNYWDKYEGYDLNKDHIGDVPYHPISLFSMLIEKYPASMLLFRSFMVALLDRTEKLIPSLTPESIRDDKPLMKSLNT